MPTNDFLPFATQAGANVMPQTDWAALAARAAGFSAGVASSAQINKALRQSSFVAAAVAQFVADNQGGNVADDGVVGNFEAQLIAAIKAAATSLFTGNQSAGSVPGYQKLPGGYILQIGSAGSLIGNAQGTVTLPTSFTSAGSYVVVMQDTGSSLTNAARWKVLSKTASSFNFTSGATDNTQIYSFDYFAFGK